MLAERTKPNEEESDWSDLENVPRLGKGIDASIEAPGLIADESGTGGGEILSKHEIKLKPFTLPETNAEREQRLGVKNLEKGMLIKTATVHATVEDRLILAPVERIILDIENVLLTKERLIVGQVEDVFGPVEHPYYSVLLDVYLRQMIEDGKLALGDPIFCISSELKALYEEQIKIMKSRKGCDASNKFDEEISGSEFAEDGDCDYSDDDAEDHIQSAKIGGGMGKRQRPEKLKKSNKQSDNPYEQDGHENYDWNVAADSGSDEEKRHQRRPTPVQPKQKEAPIPNLGSNDPAMKQAHSQSQHHPPAMMMTEPVANQPSTQPKQEFPLPSAFTGGISSLSHTQPASTQPGAYSYAFPVTAGYQPQMQHMVAAPQLMPASSVQMPSKEQLELYHSYLNQINAMYGMTGAQAYQGMYTTQPMATGFPGQFPGYTIQAVPSFGVSHTMQPQSQHPPGQDPAPQPPN